MKQLIPTSYQQLFEQAGEFSALPKPQAEVLLRNMGFRGMSLNAQAPVFYVGDYTQGKYLYLDPSCELVFGYSKEYIASEGQNFYNSIIHPADYKIFNENIFPASIRFLQGQKPADRLNYSCSYNYRVKTKDGRYVTLLQRATYFLHTVTGHPLASVGFVIDITHFKEDTKIIHTIERIDRNFSVLSAEPVYKMVYYPDKESNLLSKREKELLQLIYEGLSSKQISDKLFLSVLTINTHRKNVLRKTGCNNTSELLAYSVKNGLL